MPHAPIVEMDWAQSGSWTNVTRYVRDESGISITRGRADEQSEINPGTMSLTFHNMDGRFTPGLASSPYYPNVRKQRPIRCRVIAWAGNMLTNSSFETNTSDWSAAGTVAPALAQSNTHVQAGSQALRVTWGTGGTGPAAQTTVYGLEIGLVYTASVYVYVPSGGSPAVRLGVAGLSTGAASSTTNAFQRITYTWTATDTYAVLQVTPTTSPTSGHQVWVDAAQVVAGSSPTTYGGVDAFISTRFVGRVNEWPQSYEDGPDALVLTDITCTDLMMRFGNLDPLRSLLEEEMLFLQPDAYYTLGEPSGSASAGDTSGDGQDSMTIYQVAGAGGTVTFGDTEGPGTDALTAADFAPFSATQGKGLRANLRQATGSIAVACWLNTTTTGRDFLMVCNRFAPDGGGTAVVLNVNGSGQLQVAAFNSDDLVVSTFGAGQGFGSVNLADGNDHLVSVRIKDDGGIFASIDGVDGSSGFSFGSIIVTDVYNRIVAGGFVNPNGGAANLYDGVLSHVWYGRQSSMPDWSFAYTAGSGNTESTVDRFNRLAGLLQFSATVLGSSTTQIDAQSAGGQSPMEALRTIAAVEAGLVYPDRVSGFTFECRNYRYNKAATLTLTGGDLADLAWSDDDQFLVNDATYQRTGGADQRAIDQASKTEYGTYTPSGSTSQPWSSDHDALAAAQWAVYKGADPPPRVDRVDLDANTLSDYYTVLTLDISHVLTLTDLPDPTPFTTVDVHIEGYTENIGMVLHTITYNTSPAAPNQVWQLQTAGHSELGVTTRLGL